MINSNNLETFFTEFEEFGKNMKEYLMKTIPFSEQEKLQNAIFTEFFLVVSKTHTYVTFVTPDNKPLRFYIAIDDFKKFLEEKNKLSVYVKIEADLKIDTNKIQNTELVKSDLEYKLRKAFLRFADDSPYINYQKNILEGEGNYKITVKI